MIHYKDGGSRVPSVDGNHLEIPRVSRIHIGAYFCIASNNIPPSVSKRIELKVQFAPMVSVQMQQEFAYVGQDIALHCTSESYPLAIHFWKRSNGTAISSGNRYHVRQQVSNYITRVTMKIFNVQKEDFGVYYCVAKNSLGVSDGPVKLSERDPPPNFERPTRRPTPGPGSGKTGRRRRPGGSQAKRGHHLSTTNGINNNINLKTYSPFLPTKPSNPDSATQPEAADYPNANENFFPSIFSSGCGRSASVSRCQAWITSIILVWIVVSNRWR